ncbi:hypothetical protein D3C75_1097670 [compost metagenome]
MKSRINTVAKTGPDSGTTMDIKVFSGEAPSMEADSRISLGMSIKNWRNMNMPKQLAMNGTIRANQVSTQCRLFTTKYRGIRMLSNGTIIRAITATRMNSLPLKCSLASA